MMFTIGKLAASASVGVETVRYYQRQGLLPTPSPQGAVRHYNHDHLRQLLFIKRAQAAGFALKEIKLLLDMDASQDHAQARQLALTRLHAIDQQLEQLQNAQAALKKLAHACEHSTNQPCPIIAAFIDGP